MQTSATSSTSTPLKKRIANYICPSYSRLIDQVNRNALVRKWIKDHSHLPTLVNRSELYTHIQQHYLSTEPIDYLEFGVFEGQSLREWATLHSHPESRLVGFDSFRGLPQDWNATLKKGTFDRGGLPPSITDGRIVLVVGWFQETLPVFLRGFRPRRLVVNIDCDVYSSAAFCLAKLDPYLAPGSIIILDEFASPLDEFRAWHDYLLAFGRKAPAFAITANYAEQAAFIFE